MKKNKAIFLDRDGTIIIDKVYAYDPDTIEFISGAKEGLLRLMNAGFLLIIVTNQSGVARGEFTEKQLHHFHDRLLLLLKDSGIKITDIYYCPHHPDGTVREYSRQCYCRKPKTGMFWKAIEEYCIDLSQSYSIGDRIRDCAICYETECKGCLITQSPTLDADNDSIRVFSSWLDCVDSILLRDEQMCKRAHGVDQNIEGDGYDRRSS